MRSQNGKVAANRDIEVLSHVFTKAIEWGLCEDHPIKGKVRKNVVRPRLRYVEDWEVLEALKVASPFLSAYIQLKLLTGLRRSDLLSIKLSDLKSEGIHVVPRKTAHSTGKEMLFEWSKDLQTVKMKPGLCVAKSFPVGFSIRIKVSLILNQTVLQMFLIQFGSVV